MASNETINTIIEAKNQIFSENIKGLLLMNGGGAVALATWLQAIWEKEWAAPMLHWQLWGMAALGSGVFCAGMAFLFRFLAFYHPKTNTPLSNPFWWTHVIANFLSVVVFGVAVCLIVIGGFAALA